MAFRICFRAALVYVIVLASGCASSGNTVHHQTTIKPIGSVDGTILDTPSSAQYEVRPGENFLRPHKVLSNKKPAYPENLLSRRLPPIEIQVRIVVSAEGVVTSATPIGSTSDQNNPFLDAVVTTLSTWRFYPLFKFDASGKAVKLPFHQDYSFIFKQIDGKGVVSESGGQS